MILRYYQADLVEASRRAFAEKIRRLLLVLGTGGGKTVIFSYIAAYAAMKGNRTWILAHRKELINQASKTLNAFGVDHGIIKANVKPNPLFSTQVASVGSLGSRIGKLAPPQLIVIDEAHHSTSNSYGRIISAYPDAKILGVTATPCRLDGKGLGGVFERMILGPSVTTLTDEGFLSPVRYFAPPRQVDRSSLRKTRGDYAVADMADMMNKRRITGDAIENYQRLCDGVSMLAFCVDVQHAKDVAHAYIAAGYPATWVDGDLSDDEREDRLGGFENGNYLIVTSCELIGEGLDIPRVVAAQLLRPTASLALHRQHIGRVLRIFEGKECAYVLDHVGNLDEHGFAHTEIEWTLDGVIRKKKTGDDEKDILIKTCSECYSVHEPAPACPYCGFVYIIKPRKLEIVKGTLAEITDFERAAKKDQVTAAKSFGDLLAIGRARGYKNPSFWARQVMASRFAKRKFTNP